MLDFTTIQPGTLPTGTVTPLGTVEAASFTAYRMTDGAWVPFYRVHGAYQPASPLIHPPLMSDRRKARESTRCTDGGNTHAYESTGLGDNAQGVFCVTRRCVWCGARQAKPYGSGARTAWRADQ